MGLFDLFKKTPNEDQFSEIAIAALKATDTFNSIKYDHENFLLQLDQDAHHIWYLSNAFNEYCNAKKSERKAILERYIQSIIDIKSSAIPDDYIEAKDRLYPGVRESAEIEFLRLRAKFDGEDFKETATKPLADLLIKVIIYDSEKSMSLLSVNMLTEWGVSYDEAFDQALDNLRRISSKPFQQLQPGLYASPWEDEYDASRLLLPELFYRLNLNGKPVASIPNRSTLLVTGSEDETGLANLAELTLKVIEDTPKTLSGFVLILEDQQWAPYPIQDRPIDLPIVNLIKRWDSHIYSEQKSNLEHFFQKHGIDIFVASALLMKKEESGKMTSLCVWSEDVDTLLPKTDLIAIRKENDQQAMVPWDKVETLVGDLMEATDHSPVRYRVKTFPTDEQFSQLLSLNIE